MTAWGTKGCPRKVRQTSRSAAGVAQDDMFERRARSHAPPPHGWTTITLPSSLLTHFANTMAATSIVRMKVALLPRIVSRPRGVTAAAPTQSTRRQRCRGQAWQWPTRCTFSSPTWESADGCASLAGLCGPVTPGHGAAGDRETSGCVVETACGPSVAGHCAHCATTPRHPPQINCERHRRRRQPRWSSRYCDRWRCCGCPQQLCGWIPCEKTCPPPPIPRPLPGPSAAQASRVPPVWTPVAVVRRLEAMVRRALAAVRRPVTVDAVAGGSGRAARDGGVVARGDGRAVGNRADGGVPTPSSSGPLSRCCMRKPRSWSQCRNRLCLCGGCPCRWRRPPAPPTLPPLLRAVPVAALPVRVLTLRQPMAVGRTSKWNDHRR